MMIMTRRMYDISTVVHIFSAAAIDIGRCDDYNDDDICTNTLMTMTTIMMIMVKQLSMIMIDDNCIDDQ